MCQIGGHTELRGQKAKLQVKTHGRTSGGKNVGRKYCAAEALLQFLHPRTVYQERTILLLTSSWLLPSAGCFWNLLTSFSQIWKQTQDQISSSPNVIPPQNNQLLVEDTQIHICYVEKAGIKTHILTAPKGSSQSVHSSNPSHGMCSCMASKRGRRQGRHCRGKEEKDKEHKSSRK